MEEELSRRREECIQLRTTLASETRRTGHVYNEVHQEEPFAINEDDELKMAYQTQKDLNKFVDVFAKFCKKY